MSVFKLHSIRKKPLKRKEKLFTVGHSRNEWPLSDVEKYVDKRFSDGMVW